MIIYTKRREADSSVGHVCLFQVGDVSAMTVVRARKCELFKLPREISKLRVVEVGEMS